jgi:hypothetical protein
MSCHDLGVETEWLISLAQLDRWMATSLTHPERRQLIIANLIAWHDKAAPILLSTKLPALTLTLESQMSIGWYNFFMGRISYLWAATQQAYLTELGKRQTGHRWATLLVTKLLAVAWDQWNHRNRIAHKMLHPWKLEQIEILNDKIREEYSLGIEELRTQPLGQAILLENTSHDAQA